MRNSKLKEAKSRAQGQTLTKGRDGHFHCIISSSKAHVVSTVQHSHLSKSVWEDSEAKYEISEQKYFPSQVRDIMKINVKIHIKHLECLLKKMFKNIQNTVVL